MQGATASGAHSPQRAAGGSWPGAAAAGIQTEAGAQGGVLLPLPGDAAQRQGWARLARHQLQALLQARQADVAQLEALLLGAK